MQEEEESHGYELLPAQFDSSSEEEEGGESDGEDVDALVERALLALMRDYEGTLRQEEASSAKVEEWLEYFETRLLALERRILLQLVRQEEAEEE